MNFATNILHLRKRAGLSQNDLARALNITRPAYKQVEVADREPSVEELKRISELFGRIASTGLTDIECTIVDKVIATLGNLIATELSDLSHEDEPWRQAKKGECLDFGLLDKTSLECAVKMGRDVGGDD